MKAEDHLWLPHSIAEQKALKYYKNLVMWLNLERTDEIFKGCCDVRSMTDITVIVVVQYFM